MAESDALKTHDSITQKTVAGLESTSHKEDNPNLQKLAEQRKTIALLFFLVVLLLVILIAIVLCAVYAGAFAVYCPSTASTQHCMNIDADAQQPVFDDGNQFDFGHDVCVGFRDIWQDPSIPPAERNQIGRAVYQTPQKMQQAVSLISYGRTYDLYYPYSKHLPFAFGRYFNTSLQCVYSTADEYGSCTLDVQTNAIGNVGTQFDSFPHLFNMKQVANGSNMSNDDFVLFNNFLATDVFDNYLGEGEDYVRYLGVHQLPTFFTRAILVDVAGYKGVTHLPNKYGITTEDFVNTLEAQSLSVDDITQGDAVLIYTGWSELIETDPVLWYSWDETPGIMEEVITDILFDTNVSVVGSDAWNTDALGLGEWGTHKILMSCGGGFNHEAVKLDEWVFDAREGNAPWIGAYIFQPLPILGGVASPGKPIVIV